MGALLRGQPELSLLTKALGGARLELVDDRLALVATVVATRPGVVVLPPFDATHTSTAPLVLRLRRDVPRVPVLVLAAHPSACGQPLLRAVQAGAEAITSPTPAQLREALRALLELGVAGH